jgi:hypothetical protein
MSGRQHVKTGTLAATATARAMPPGIKMRSRLMLHWAQIAIEQERLALEARERLEHEYAASLDVRQMAVELHAAMIGIAACAHSLDALYAELAELVGPDTLAKWAETRRPGRWAEVAGILEISFDVDVGRWRSPLRMLFVERRNPAIHPKAKDKTPEKHPALPTHVASEYVTYSVESTQESVGLLMEILLTCVDAPKPLVETWASDARAPVQDLKRLRSAADGQTGRPSPPRARPHHIRDSRPSRRGECSGPSIATRARSH